ncbi:M48 family metalloprotease [Mucilaginibacter sp. BJC16-A38]|uniref:M56 family metallopeptidase n=1 Tax=Mucilaginibacter phenanthrenivorans TaxID=1234842 RepID=UPI0021576586|nr:M56 family metallopeptidase [Mucilaginibacter phenanthrenivorans]MCR8561685.1 M48 family metalloprotease [Mucilaginibacter phenanthrenivorans]
MAHLLLISTTLNKMITAFSWMLIHSLWQGLFLAIVTGIVLVLAKRSGSAYRYNLALVLFMLFIAGCGLTFIYEWNNAASSVSLIPAAGNIIEGKSFSLFNAHTAKQLINSFTNYFSANAPFVLLIWFMVFLFKSVRMISCIAYNQRIRNYQVYQPSKYWADKVEAFSKKLKIDKAITLLQSGYIKVPVVVGHLKPVILMPVGLLAGLPVEQVEAILLHELAHIKRNDYFVNFVQNVAEAVFFFNPGLLWISSLLKEERENCCDDIALQQTNNKMEFVQALISFKEHELYGQAYATAFPGKKNYLMRRVVRILNNKNKTMGIGEKVFFTLSILILSVLITTVTIAQITVGTRTKAKQPIISTFAQKKENAVQNTVIKPNKQAANKPISSLHKMKNSMVDKPEEPILNEPAIKIEPAAMVASVVKKQPNNDQIQAELDQQQAKRDQQQAMRDQEQAKRDQEQARLDQLQATRDQAQALLAQAQAKRDQQQALKDQAQAKIDQQEAMRQKAEMDAAKVKADSNRQIPQ